MSADTMTERAREHLDKFYADMDEDDAISLARLLAQVRKEAMEEARNLSDAEIASEAECAASNIKILEGIMEHVPEDKRWGVQEVMLRLRLDVARPGVRQMLAEMMEADAIRSLSSTIEVGK